MLANILIERFHRGSKEIRLYKVSHVVFKRDIVREWVEIIAVCGTKNTKRRHQKKRNRDQEPIIGEKGSRLWRICQLYMQRRGDHVTNTALFLQCHKQWKRNEDTKKIYGFKNMAIGHNSIQSVYDNWILKTTGFNNVYYVKNKTGDKLIKKCHYSTYAHRAAQVTTAALANIANDGIACLTEHANVNEIETYIRNKKQRERCFAAREDMKNLY